MLKNRELATASINKIFDCYYTKKISNGPIMLVPFKVWLFGISDSDYTTKVKSFYTSGKSTRQEMIDSMNSLNDNFNGEDYTYEGRVHPKILFDYDIQAIVEGNAQIVKALYLIHEFPLTQEQKDAINSKLGVTLVEKDINICELL